jgi:glutamine synthetase
VISDSERTIDPDRLGTDGVELVRVSYPDLHGICRGKEIPIEAFDEIVRSGIAQTEAIMTVDLRHNVVAGFEHGFRDFWAVPDLDTLVRLPSDPAIAWCLADGRAAHGEPFDLDPRGILRREVEALERLGLAPIVGPELEFYLLERPGWQPYVARDSSVYTFGPAADPRGVVRTIIRAARDLGLKPIAAAQEYGRGQYEINLRHGPALEAADRAFRFKATVKDIAAQHGLLGTFMGQLRDDDEGSGFHLHVSLEDAAGANAFDAPDNADGLSDTARAFVAGVLEHLPALTAFLNPTINAYRRFIPDSLAPTHVNWGLETRLGAVRCPLERGAATRFELRSADGTANPYLSIAAVLAAGRDGIEHGLFPPAPVPDNPYELPEGERGAPLPRTLDAALAELDRDEWLVRQLGSPVCRTFRTIKQAELVRWRAELAKVTEWERHEYAHHL